MNEFLSMGGYAAFVWPSYGLSALVMAVLLVASLRSLTATENEFSRLKQNGANQQETEPGNGDEA